MTLLYYLYYQRDSSYCQTLRLVKRETIYTEFENSYMLWSNHCLIFPWRGNTRIYNQSHFCSANLLLEDALISSKSDLHNGRKKEKRNYGKVKNNKTMFKILLFIRILYLKKQSSILWSFFMLKFEKSSFNNEFLSFIFHSKMIVHRAEKDQIKYFAQNLLDKIAFFHMQTATWRSCCCHKLLFHHLRNFRLLKCIIIWTNTTTITFI